MPDRKKLLERLKERLEREEAYLKALGMFEGRDRTWKKYFYQGRISLLKELIDMLEEE